ncbi:hypothetical protein cyc_07895 [Cyclospora cayetanensis]|uniref:Uncharacterized protein n=1 Tax=Cyclospora cayetanensis TaxID=88456 RepID=A0A1D3D0K9_9EIME|nr:hypothetical protein cyc_07895 [Cyclospora cayetanensis]
MPQRGSSGENEGRKSVEEGQQTVSKCAIRERLAKVIRAACGWCVVCYWVLRSRKQVEDGTGCLETALGSSSCFLVLLVLPG